MKKTYMTPEAEKIQFNYRDQVVVASNDGSTPGLGEFYGNDSWLVSGCKMYLAEAFGLSDCNYFSLR